MKMLISTLLLGVFAISNVQAQPFMTWFMDAQKDQRRKTIRDYDNLAEYLTDMSRNSYRTWSGVYPYETEDEKPDENNSANSLLMQHSILNVARFTWRVGLNATSLFFPGSSCMMNLHDHNDIPAAARGARLLMATMYQSCEAPFITIPNTLSVKQSPVSKGRDRSIRGNRNLEKYKKFNPYLANRKEPKNGCFKIEDQPPIYGYGAKATVNKNGAINLHRNQAARGICGHKLGRSGVGCSSKPASGIDCSGLILASLSRMGLNMEQWDEHHPGETGTSGLASIAGKKNSCFEYVKAGTQKSLDVGDIINIGNNHVVMVDEVGADPLGIKKHLARGTCKQISVRDFDFRFIHSGALGHLGVARVDATHPEIAGFLQPLAVKAQAACYKMKTKGDQVIANSTGSGLSVFRHVGDKKSGCKSKENKFENEECVDGCNI